MIRLFQFDADPPLRNLARLLPIALLLCMGHVPSLQAQSSNGTPEAPASPDAATVAPLPAPPVSTFGAATSFPALSARSVPFTFSTSTSYSGQTLDAGRNIRFGAPRMGSSNQGAFDGFMLNGSKNSGQGVSQTGEPAGSGRAGRFGASPFALPSLGEAPTAKMGIQFGLFANSLKNPNQDGTKAGGLFDIANRFSSTSMFADSDLGNGVRFTAGTDFGGHRTVGAPVAGTGPSGAPKQKGASLALKLSF